MQRVAFITAVIGLLGCKGKDTKTPENAIDVKIQPASYGENVNVPEEVTERCEFDEKVAKAVVGATPGAEYSASGGTGKVLEMTIVSMRGLDPKWQGERHVTVEGRFTDEGMETHTFKVRRSVMGGFLGGMMGVCLDLGKIAEAMGDDISVWLEQPQSAARLGEL